MAKRHRSIDEFELMDLSLNEGPAAAAGRARELLAADQVPKGITRTELLLELSEYLELSGELDQAETIVREVLAGGERTVPDARIRLAELLGRRGDRAGCDALLAEVWKRRPDVPYDYVAVAELLEELGDAAAALRWANTGAFRLLRDERVPAGTAVALLQLRRSLRLDMGFTEDEYDLLAVEDAGIDDDLDGDDEG